MLLLIKSYQKICTKTMQNIWLTIQKLCKTLNLYIFCVQGLYKSKVCVMMNVQKIYIKFLHVNKKCTNCTKLVQSSN